MIATTATSTTSSSSMMNHGTTSSCIKQDSSFDSFAAMASSPMMTSSPPPNTSNTMMLTRNPPRVSIYTDSGSGDSLENTATKQEENMTSSLMMDRKPMMIRGSRHSQDIASSSFGLRRNGNGMMRRSDPGTSSSRNNERWVGLDWSVSAKGRDSKSNRSRAIYNQTFSTTTESANNHKRRRNDTSSVSFTSSPTRTQDSCSSLFDIHSSAAALDERSTVERNGVQLIPIAEDCFTPKNNNSTRTAIHQDAFQQCLADAHGMLEQFDMQCYGIPTTRK